MRKWRIAAVAGLLIAAGAMGVLLLPRGHVSRPDIGFLEMKEIASALVFYAGEHGGRPPPDLAALAALLRAKELGQGTVYQLLSQNGDGKLTYTPTPPGARHQRAWVVVDLSPDYVAQHGQFRWGHPAVAEFAPFGKGEYFCHFVGTLPYCLPESLRNAGGKHVRLSKEEVRAFLGTPDEPGLLYVTDVEAGIVASRAGYFVEASETEYIFRSAEDPAAAE